MTQNRRKEHVVRYKFIYTFLILFVYMLGRQIHLYGLDPSAYQKDTSSAGNLLMLTVGGDVYQSSIFALGISPFMIASLITQMVMAYRKSVMKAKVSMIRTNRATVTLTLVFAIWQAFFHVQSLPFLATGEERILAQGVAGLEMVVGVLLIMRLSERNKRYGFGGQTAIIIVNIVDGMANTLGGQPKEKLMLPVLIAIVLFPIMLILENTEKRIPLQRVSIHNIYADENYLAIKFNPIGVMPMMFASAFFMLPKLAVSGLVYMFPQVPELQWWAENMTLMKPLGIVVYIIVLYLLTIIFSGIMLAPGDLAEQFLKSGDSIVNLHAGDDTERYLKHNVFCMSFISATVMSICVAIPLVLQFEGSIDSALVMFPTSALMIVGLWCTQFREFTAIKSFDEYKPFL